MELLNGRKHTSALLAQPKHRNQLRVIVSIVFIFMGYRNTLQIQLIRLSW